MSKVIIFDMDGVLFDTGSIVEKSVLAQYPGMTVEMGKELLAGNFHDAIRDFHLERITETPEEMAERKAKYEIEKSNAPMYIGARKLLQDLHNMGYKIVLNTSAYERYCVPLLEKAGIKELFDMIGTAEVSKSKVEKFEIIKEKYNASLDDMIFITDTLGDIREAEQAHISTIAVSWGAHDHSFFNRMPLSNLVAIVDSMQELEEVIEKRWK